MARWYQHVFSGEQVEAKTLEEDDNYVDVSIWSRIAAPSPAAKPEPKPEPDYDQMAEDKAVAESEVAPVKPLAQKRAWNSKT